MLDAWKMALESIIYEPPTVRKAAEARRIMLGVRRLGRVQSVHELHCCYTRVQSAIGQAANGAEPRRGTSTTTLRIRDAAFGLRYLEIVTGRSIDIHACRYLSWLLAAA